MKAPLTFLYFLCGMDWPSRKQATTSLLLIFCKNNQRKRKSLKPNNSGTRPRRANWKAYSESSRCQLSKEGQSIPQRKYRKVKGAFIKRSQFVFLSFIRLSVFLILNSLQQPSFSLPLPFFFLNLSIYRQSKIFGQHTQGEWETITGTALTLPCTTFKHVLDCLVFMVRIKWTLWGCFTFTIILMMKIYQFLWWK